MTSNTDNVMKYDDDDDDDNTGQRKLTQVDFQ